jgi:DNA-binding NtrC family response regulator
MVPSSILCVDDHDTCSNLADILDDLGYQVDVAYNTTDALSSLSRKDYPMGVFTVDTPDVDGVKLWRQMKERQGKHACVMVTENIMVSAEVRNLGDRCLLLTKPTDVARMIAFIEKSAGQLVQAN